MSTPEGRFPGRREPLRPEADEPREELATRLGRWAKAKGPRREKVTAQDIMDRAQARRERREAAAQGRPPRDLGATARAVAAVLMAVAAIALFVLAQADSSAHSAQAAELDRRISELRAEVSDAQGEARAATFDPQAGAATLEGAEEAAQRVAELQTEYHGLRLTTEVDEDGVGQLVGAEDYDRVQGELKGLFAEETQLGEALDPTLQWFLMWDEVEPGTWERSPGDAYAWTSPRAWTILDGSTVRVVWQLHEAATGNMLGWATATYRAETGRFDDVRLGVTSYGEARIAPTDSGIAGDSDLHEPAPGAPEPSEEPTEDEEGQR